MLPPQPARSEPSAPWPRRTCPAWPTRATKAKPTVGAVGDRFIMIRDLSGNPSNVFGAEGELLLSREYGIPPTRGTEQVTVNGNTRRPPTSPRPRPPTDAPRWVTNDRRQKRALVHVHWSIGGSCHLPVGPVQSYRFRGGPWSRAVSGSRVAMVSGWASPSTRS